MDVYRTITIYTDGHAVDLSESEAAGLVELGLITPHPGAGSDGITTNDYKLTEETSWDAVTDALADIHHKS
jgi:hypothetical protein